MTPTPGRERVLLTGDHAIAQAAALARPHVLPVYPITPQTPVLEKLVELGARGELSGDLMTVESEHSAMAACMPSIRCENASSCTGSSGWTRARWRWPRARRCWAARYPNAWLGKAMV